MLYLLKWFVPYWLRNKKIMAVVIVFGVLASALRAYMPLLIKNIINGMYTTLNAQYIQENVIAIIILGLLLFVTNMLAMTGRSYMNIKIETEARDIVFKHILKLDQEFYQKFGTGEIITRLIDDCEEKISWFACSGIFRAFQSFLVFLFSVTLMLKLNWYLTIWALLPMPILLYIYMKAGNALTFRFNKLQQSISQIYKLLDACFNGIRIIKANSKEVSQTKSFYNRALKQKNREISTVKVQGIFDSLFQYIGFLCTALVFFGGGKLVIGGQITLGELIAFQFYSAMLVWPVLDISAFFVRGKRARVSVDRIDEMLNTAPSVSMPANPKKLPSKIKKVQAVNMGYQIDGAQILRDINFTAETGKRIAFVGKIGSGKSTVAMLLVRLADVSFGSILMDGSDIKDYDFNLLRAKVGYVPQQSILFSTSIADNILMGKKVSDKDLARAIKIAQLEKELPNFKDGLDTVLGDKGATISGGQKQRVAIARALVGKPDILILDDCTSAMDAQTEENLWNDLAQFMPNVICFLVTHRTKTISKSDYIITLDKGQIAQEGTHLKLMRQGGLYKQIYQEERLREEYSKMADKL